MRVFFLSLFFICLAFTSNACASLCGLDPTFIARGDSITITWEENCKEAAYYIFSYKEVSSLDWTYIKIEKTDSNVQRYVAKNMPIRKNQRCTRYGIKLESFSKNGELIAGSPQPVCCLEGIYVKLPCNDPLGIQVNNITRNQAVISWRNETNASQYIVYVRPVGGSTIAYPGVSSSRTIPNLRPNTEYEFRIRTLCPNNRMSPFTSWRRFHTNP